MPDYASISGHFARCFAYFARVSGVRVVRSEIIDCGELVQNAASCYYMLVVKLVVKRKMVTTKGFVFYSSKISHKFSSYVEYGSKISSKI